MKKADGLKCGTLAEQCTAANDSGLRCVRSTKQLEQFENSVQKDLHAVKHNGRSVVKVLS